MAPSVASPPPLGLIWLHCSAASQNNVLRVVAMTISLGDGADYANFVGFRGSVPLLPHLCPLSVPEVGVCGVYLESP